MSVLDLGSLVGRVELDTRPFDLAYARTQKQMAELAARAEATAAGTATLDRSLATTAESSDAAAVGLSRTDTALRAAASAASGAAGSMTQLEVANLRLVAAEDRLDAALLDTSASASKLATAYASVLTATERVNAMQTRETQTAEAAAAAQARHAAAVERVAGVMAPTVRSTEALRTATLRQVAAQERLDTLMASGTASTGRLAAAQATLARADEAVASERARVGRAFLTFGAVVVGGFALAAREMASFEQRMALVQTLSRATAGQMSGLSDAALHVGRAYGFTANQVADAEAELVKAGLNVHAILTGALTGALTLAAAGQESVAEATETAAFAMTQFSLKGKDVPHIADLLAAGADKALGSVDDLSQALKYGGLAASQAGFSLEETVGTLAEFAQAGQMGSRAGQALQMMLRNLQHPSAAGAAIMDEYGIRIYDASGKMLDLTDIAGQLHNKLGGLSDEQQKAALATLFNANAVRAATILMRDGAKVNQHWIDLVNDQGFAALQAAGKMNSLSGDVSKLKASLQTAFIGAGEGANGPLRVLVQDLTSVVDAWNNLPGPAKTSVEAFGGVAGSAALVGGAMLILIPKIAATKEALTTLGISGSRTAGILGKGGLLVGAILATTVAVGSIDQAMGDAAINADSMTASIERLGRSGAINGALVQAFGKNFEDLSSAMSLASDRGFNFAGINLHLGGGWHHGHEFTDARDKIQAVDEALASLQKSGHARLAAQAFDRISTAARGQGKSVDDVAKLFPRYAGAVDLATTDTKQLGTAADRASTQMDDLDKSWGRLTGDFLGRAQATLQAKNDLVSFKQALDKSNGSLSLSTAKGREARGALLQLSGDIKDVVDSTYKQTGSYDKARDAAKRWLQGVKDSGAAGPFVKQLTGHIHDYLKLLADDGQRQGARFGQGIEHGIEKASPAAIAAAIRLAQGVAAATRGVRGFHISSPSKVGLSIGMNYADAVGAGISASTPKAQGAAISMAEGILAGVADATDPQAYQTQAARAIGGFIHGLEKQEGPLQATVDRLTAHLQSLRSDRSGFIGDVRSTLVGAASLTGYGTTNPAGMITGLRRTDRQERQFGRGLALLDKRGLRPDIVNELYREGLDALPTIIGLTHATHGQIRQIDTLRGDINRRARQYATSRADTLYGADIAEAKATLVTMKDHLHDIEHTMHRLERIEQSIEKKTSTAEENARALNKVTSSAGAGSRRRGRG